MKKSYLFSLFIVCAFYSFGQTGIPVPSMTSCDDNIEQFMSNYDIPGLSIAIAKDGRLVYHRAFGYADVDKTEAAYPYHLFRIASVSKPITSIAIMKLYQEGALQMNQKVFGSGGILENHPFLSQATITDNRIYDITVQQLLEHSAGWNRDLDCFPDPMSPYPWKFGGCDPIIAPLHVAQSNGTSNPVNSEDMIYFLLEKGLDFDPGTKFHYSNIGFLVLGEIIETLTKKSYEDYLKTEILDPLAAYDLHIAKNLLADKQEREVEYTGNGYTTLDCYGNGESVPWEYGGLNVEAMNAHGGWIASTRDLLRLITAVDGFSTRPDILNSATITTMTTPSANSNFYAKGWTVNSANNWWHTGAIDGTATVIVRSNSGYTWAMFLNKRVINENANAFWSDLDNLPWSCLASATAFPDFDLFASPGQPASGLTTIGLNGVGVLTWTTGDGEKRIVVAKKGSPVDRFPVDGLSYSANETFGMGSDLGNGNYVVYDGNGSSTSVQNLSPDEPYYFRIFEYNQNETTGNNKLYLLANSESTLYQCSAVSANIASDDRTEICQGDSVLLSAMGTGNFQ